MRYRSTVLPTFKHAAVLIGLITVVVAGCSKREAEEKPVVPPPALESPAAPVLSAQDIANALKDMLTMGATQAIAELSVQDGFLKNPEVTIPLPTGLMEIDRQLRLVGKERYADEFVVAMNRAAEAAVAEAGPIFAEAVRDVTFPDPEQILKGPDDAATQYFRRASQARLEQSLLPVVEQAADRTGAVAAYTNLMQRAAFLGKFMPEPEVNVGQYVTDKMLAGVFKVIAEEERRIRNDPAARTSDALKKVFNTAAK